MREVEGAARAVALPSVVAAAEAAYHGIRRGLRELVGYLRDRYPDYGNPSALVLSAVTAFTRKERTPA
jgi:hypothetical protein